MHIYIIKTFFTIDLFFSHKVTTITETYKITTKIEWGQLSGTMGLKQTEGYSVIWGAADQEILWSAIE